MRTIGLLVGMTLLGCQPAAPPTSTSAPADSAAPSAATPTAGNEGAAPSPPTPDPIEAALAGDRSAADQALDPGRQPGELLRFFGIQPGMRVAELGAGTGYTTELLARVVGSEGEVYAQNSAFILERFAEEPLSERLRKPVMGNVVRVDREFDDPLPGEAVELDAVLNILFYHDTYWMKIDRAQMNAAVFRALKPGGVYGVIDHSAREGAGATGVKTLHRIERRLVVEEIQAAGFELIASSDAWRNPEDARDWNASPSQAGERRGTSDRFALKFVRPR